MRSNVSVCALMALLCNGITQAELVFTETFDGGSNVGGWTYGAGEGIPPGGGNPGAFLRTPFIDTFAPQPATDGDVDSIFNGDYRANQVSSVGVDLTLFYVDFSADGRQLSVLLYHDNGTPGNSGDDWAAFHVGPDNIPLVGEGWLSYDFDIPSQSNTLPAGWDFIEFGPAADPDWNTVITDVASLGFFYGDPTFFYIFQVWDTGLDNARISYVPEPTTASLMTALGGLLLRRRFRGR